MPRHKRTAGVAEARPPATAPRGEPGAKTREQRLAALGVFGFIRSEPLILAALVTEDPMLLTGNSGTGKTFLLNSISEALGLEHRHYNASLISFDDLVGFPYPDEERSAIRFLETPATVWNAQSVLIDEISRCRPEHQNRLFSLVHERRIQGVALPRLRFRWAAMNPCSPDQGAGETYAGSEALDPALADRFSLFIEADDWGALSDDDRRRIADPGGEGRVSQDAGRLAGDLAVWRRAFLHALSDCPAQIVDYVVLAVSTLNASGIRMSPRRSRLLSRSLLAARVISGGEDPELFHRVLAASLPHRTWGAQPSDAVIAAAHRAAWDGSRESAHAWVHRLLAEPSASRQLAILLAQCPSPDAGAQAVAQLLAGPDPVARSVFAFTTYPAAAAGRLPIGAEGVNDLGKIAGAIYAVDGVITWEENPIQKRHPGLAAMARVLDGLEGARRERALQFFNWALAGNVAIADPGAAEREIHACVTLLKEVVDR
jgi:MoxR-like ATPase